MTTLATTMLKARGLKKYYGKDTGLVRGVDGVDLDIEPGETVAIMGPSGCGKSTVLHLLSGLDRPTGGEVWLEGRRIEEMSERQLARWRREKVGVVFQAFHLVDELTARERRASRVAGGALAEARPSSCDRAPRPCRSRRPGSPPPLGLVRWAAPARGHCPGARQRPRRRVRRRAHGQPGHQRDSRGAQAVRRPACLRTHDRGRHARRANRGDRRSPDLDA